MGKDPYFCIIATGLQEKWALLSEDTSPREEIIFASLGDLFVPQMGMKERPAVGRYSFAW